MTSSSSSSSMTEAEPADEASELQMMNDADVKQADEASELQMMNDADVKQNRVLITKFLEVSSLFSR